MDLGKNNWVNSCGAGLWPALHNAGGTPAPQYENDQLISARLLWMDKMAYTPGRDMTVRHPFWGMAEDVRQNRASLFDVQSRGYYTEYQLGFPDSTYTTANLSALGK